MNRLPSLVAVVTILAALASVLCAADPPPTTVTKLIPSSNGFRHDFGSRAPGDVLTVVVGADPTYALVSGAVTGGNPIWVGQGLFTATATMPDHQAGQHDGTFAGKFRPPGQAGGGVAGSTPLPEWSGPRQIRGYRQRDRETRPRRDPRYAAHCRRVREGGLLAHRFVVADGVEGERGRSPDRNRRALALVGAARRRRGHQITARLATGGTCTATMQVVPPQSLSGALDAEWTTGPDYDEVNGTIPPGTAGAGMFLTMTVAPLNVCFGYCEASEVPTAGENVLGYFTTLTAAQLFHSSAGRWWIITDDNEWFDTAATSGAPPPWLIGSYQWTIPNHYRCLGEADAGTLYDTTVQAFTIGADGTMTVDKVSQNTSRTP